MTIDVEALFPFRDQLGEGPHWDPATDTLLRVDAVSAFVHRLDPMTGQQTTLQFDSSVGFAVTAPDGALLVGAGHSILQVQHDGIRVELCQVDVGDADLRINDGKCDSRGRVFFGSISASRQSSGGLYRLDGRRLERVLDGITISNGMGWDDARSRYYYIDSWQQRIDVFDYDLHSGEMTGRRPFVEIAPELGLPDGMAIDAEGGVWLAVFYRGAVHRYDPDGKLSEIVRVPASLTTSAAFGGPDLRTLYITSARHRLNDRQRGEQPLAGAVFACEPGVAGAPVTGYAGVS